MGPGTVFWRNYVAVLTLPPFEIFLLNTVIITVLSVGRRTGVVGRGAYSFARLCRHGAQAAGYHSCESVVGFWLPLTGYKNGRGGGPVYGRSEGVYRAVEWIMDMPRTGG